MKAEQLTKSDVYDLLKTVKDPEIPVLSVLDLGIVRDVQFRDPVVEVTITPTYSGCPAMNAIEEDIRKALEQEGLEVSITTVLAPPWTTDWLSETGRKKLEEFGIAPPVSTSANKRALMGLDTEIKCPRCKSTDTTMVSQFGSTACKALYKCRECLEPFDYFKCI